MNIKEVALRAPKYGHVKSAKTSIAHSTSLARLGSSRSAFEQEVPDNTAQNVYTTLAGNRVLVDDGAILKECLEDRVPNK